MKRTIVLTSFLLLLLFAAVVAALRYFLPVYIETSVLPEVARQMGTPVALEVRRIGLSGADLTRIVIGGRDEALLTIGAVHLDYTPFGLLRKKIGRIAVSGVGLNLKVVNGSVLLPWEEGAGKNRTASEPASTQPGFSAFDLPLSFDRVTMDHGLLRLAVDNRIIEMPFGLELTMTDNGGRLLRGKADLSVNGQPAWVSAAVDLKSLAATMQARADALDLAALAGLFGPGRATKVKGLLDVEQEARLVIYPFKITTARVRCTVHDTEIPLPGGQVFSNSRDAEGKEVPFRLEADLAADNTFKITAARLVHGGTGAAVAAEALLSYQEKEDGYDLAGNGSVTVAMAEKAPPDRRFDFSPLAIQLTLDGRINNDGTWSANLSGRPQEELLSVRTPAAAASARMKGFEAEGKGRGDNFAANFSLRLQDGEVRAGALAAAIPGLFVSGGYRDGRVRTTAELAKASITDKDSAVTVSGIAGRLPFSWPQAPDDEKGELSVGNISLDRHRLGGLTASIAQTAAGYALTGRFASVIPAGMEIGLQGAADIFSAPGPTGSLTFSSSGFRRVAPVDLGRFSPAASGFDVEGEMLLDGRVAYNSCGLTGSLLVQLRNGSVSAAARELEVKGISLDLSVPELLRFKSAPRQRLGFASFKMGNIVAADGEAEFQIESPQSVLIERSSVKWCDGHVYTQAMRFSPKIKDYDFTLFCDRLSFAMLLDQFAAATAKGKGRVNGRIPVRITDGAISFHDGFLYSTPGEGGTVRLKESELLTAGVPANSPQFAQIDLAREALKDFDYNWTKLDVNTEGEDLLLHLEIDGKPANVLPFVYKKEFGGFARVEAGSPGSRFQGIKLDVNFRLPLNQILYYGTSIKGLIN